MSEAPPSPNPLLLKGFRPRPETINKIVKRLRALTLKLLPSEVPVDVLNDPTSRVITPAVINAYAEAAGDFHEALPYCLLRARQTFVWDANHNPADYGENTGRAAACEILARRIVHQFDSNMLHDVMSSRYRYLDWDGEPSAIASALELAVDQHCTIFLSSTEAQLVINSLWRGDWLQKNNDDNDIDYVSYDELRRKGQVPYLDPSRIGVPRYQDWLRLVIWIFFLFVYSQSVQQPLEFQKDPHFDVWELIMYGMAVSYAIEDVSKIAKILRYFSWRAFGFWNFVALLTDALFVVAFTLRVVGITVYGDDHTGKREQIKLQSFQVLSCIAPLLWMKVITVLDGFKFIGTMQICVSRMLQESTIFIGLLFVLGLGFAQAMYALDASDGQTGHGYLVIHQLVQALLQSPNFDAQESPIGLILYYLWSACATIILLNILISLFSSAYSDVTEDAAAEFLAFFAQKTIGMIRAPDNYVFPAPFNIVETFFVVPVSYFLADAQYANLSSTVMKVLFFPVLVLIRLFEQHIDTPHNRYMRSFFPIDYSAGEEDDPSIQDPLVDPSEEEGFTGRDANINGGANGHSEGLRISKVKFEDIVKRFPDPTQSMEGSILRQIKELQAQVEALTHAHVQAMGPLIEVKKEEED